MRPIIRIYWGSKDKNQASEALYRLMFADSEIESVLADYGILKKEVNHILRHAWKKSPIIQQELTRFIDAQRSKLNVKSRITFEVSSFKDDCPNTYATIIEKTLGKLIALEKNKAKVLYSDQKQAINNVARNLFNANKLSSLFNDNDETVTELDNGSNRALDQSVPNRNDNSGSVLPIAPIAVDAEIPTMPDDDSAHQVSVTEEVNDTESEEELDKLITQRQALIGKKQALLARRQAFILEDKPFDRVVKMNRDIRIIQESINRVEESIDNHAPSIPRLNSTYHAWA